MAMTGEWQSQRACKRRSPSLELIARQQCCCTDLVHQGMLAISCVSGSSTHYIIAVQTSKQAAVGFTGMNTRSGDLMTIKAKLVGGSSATPAGNLPTAVWALQCAIRHTESNPN